MAAMSNYLEDKLMNHIFRNQAFTGPSVVYLALYSSDPQDDASGTELAGYGYERMPFNATAPVDGEISNDADIAFPQATANWPIITHVAIYDAKTFGNMLFYGQLSEQVQVNSGDAFMIPAGQLSVSIG